jgi:ribosomal protein S18 acetylase RimI-like enzyme
MLTEFIYIDRDDYEKLEEFDKRAFSAADRYDLERWLEKNYECWLMLLNGQTIGYCAFLNECDIEPYNKMDDVLYIISTAILPEFQRQGWGTVLKAWEIAYARRNMYKLMVTGCRKSNTAMINLNLRFGFQYAFEISDYYSDPVESAVILSLKVK